MWVVITGSLSSGVGEVFGPFECAEDASAYASRFLSEWWIIVEAQDVRGDMQ
jgi:hypothetical protein